MALKMEENISIIQVGSREYSNSNPEGANCENCGKNVQKPLFTRLASGKVLKEYYACPRCLSEIMSVDVQKKDEIQQKEVPKKEEIKPETSKVENVKGTIPGCKNTIGYLKKRPKDTPIPEECFICSKMIDCMAY